MTYVKISADQIDELLVEVDVAVETSQKANLLGDDPESDPVFKKIKNMRDGLEWEWQDFLKLAKPRSKEGLYTMKTVRLRYLELQAELQMLSKSNARRSVKNRFGLYTSLIERRVLLAPHKAYELKGRFEETGPVIFDIASTLAKVADNLKKRPWTGNEIDRWEDAEINAALTINSIIKFMVGVPFQIEDHEDVLSQIRSEVNILKDCVFGNRSTAESEGMIPRLTAIQAHLQEMQKCYDKRANDFAIAKLGRTSVEDRELAHYGLAPGDLQQTPLVLARMTSRSTDAIKGCGLSILYTGDTTTFQHRLGGYAVVVKKLLPDKCSLSLEVPGKVVAVKISKSANGSVAMANLRTFREAAQWAAVCSESRGMTDENGGKYLAPLLGLWGNIDDGRPGLVSIWCDHCHLGEYLRGLCPPTITRLTILSKIAKGVWFLHSCKETIIHGDLKSSNVLILDGDPLITDFGLSKCLEEKKGFTTNGYYYSDGFRAPELEPEYRYKSLALYPSTKSDVYAFACVMFEALSDKEVYEGFTDRQKKEWIDSEQDYTPLLVEFKRKAEHQYPFEYPHLELLTNCFQFHASRRPSMDEVVKTLKTHEEFQRNRLPVFSA